MLVHAGTHSPDLAESRYDPQKWCYLCLFPSARIMALRRHTKLAPGYL